MRLIVPLTGTVKNYGDEGYGDLNDPIRIIDLDLGNVSWELLALDFENEVAEIEVRPSEVISKDTGQVDSEGRPIYTTRSATSEEKQGFLDYAKTLIQGHTVNELYQISGSPRLKKPIIAKEKLGGLR